MEVVEPQEMYEMLETDYCHQVPLEFRCWKWRMEPAKNKAVR